MKTLMFFFLAGAILGAEFATAQDYLLVGSSGTNLHSVVFAEENGRLVIRNKATQPALGTVGVTSVFQSGPEDFDIYYTYAKPATSAPALARLSFSTDQGATFSNFRNKQYPFVLGSFSNMGIATDTNHCLFRTQKSPKEDVFFFNVNSTRDPFGAGKKIFDNPPGSTLRSTCISRRGRFAVSSTSHPSSGENFHFAFNPFTDSRRTFFAHVANPVINTSISDPTSAGNPVVVYRELKTAGSSYQTSVYVRAFHAVTGQPFPAKKLAGPTTTVPGSYEYNSMFFNTVDTSDDGRWVFWTKPGPGCGIFWELWARRLNPAAGFAGAPVRPLGQCNRLLGDAGSTDPIAFRSLDVWTIE